MKHKVRKKHQNSKHCFVCGLKNDAARQVLKNVQSIFIPLEAAQSVFYESTLNRYAAATARTYPGVEQMHPNAQAALLSLVYNRGTSLSGPGRQWATWAYPMIKQIHAPKELTPKNTAYTNFLTADGAVTRGSIYAGK